MKALILAAGMGNRLEERTRTIPKALVSVAGKTLLEHVLHFLQQPAIQSIGLVTGYQQTALLDFARTHYPELQLFHNPQYQNGSILTVQAARTFLDDDFLLCNVDHIYPKRLLAKLPLPVPTLGAVCDFDRPLAKDDMKVQLNAKRQVARIDKKLTTFDCGYIGMTYCNRHSLPAYWEAAEETLATRGPKACVEAILDLLAPRLPIHILDASGVGWLEVDNEADLQKAEATLNHNAHFSD